MRKNLDVNDVVFGFDTWFFRSQYREHEGKNQNKEKISTSQGSSCSLHEHISRAAGSNLYDVYCYRKDAFLLGNRQ
jgi:hypothetical protein